MHYHTLLHLQNYQWFPVKNENNPLLIKAAYLQVHIISCHKIISKIPAES